MIYVIVVASRFNDLESLAVWNRVGLWALNLREP